MGDLVGLWLPLVLLLGVFFFLASRMSKKQMGSYSEHVAEVKAINDELIALNRETVSELREIKQILKDRN